jgi:ABC-2 type transport system ATP-binding protein
VSGLAAGSFGGAGIWLSYDGVPALQDVSAAAARGQLTAVVGGDGAGKTSLLRCLAGALRPDAGQIRGPGRLRTGYLPASSGVYPDLTVAENLAFRATAYRMLPATAAQREAELLERAGLTAARDKLAGALSGGMRQKLGVIAAMLHQPDLLILDEPSTGVDPVSRSGLWRLIVSAAASGAAVILTTTYLDDAQRAGTIVALDAGLVLAEGTPGQIVAALPGSVRQLPSQPAGPAARRAWRRAAGWRVWVPAGEAADGLAIEPDLQDAVTVAALARELAAAPSGPDIAVPAAAPAKAPGHAPAPAAPSAGGPLAQTRNVTCRFGGVLAVRDVSISVSPGEVVGLLGANGAGKTTLIRILLGLLRPAAGQVSLLGGPPARQTRQRIGYVPQGLGLYADLTVAENLEFAAAVFGVPAGQVEPPLRSGRPVGQLPLGLQRRAAFAQALAHRPELLILDEPTSGVDPLGRARLWQTISAAAAAGAGALVSTHYLEEASECDRLIIMAAGEVVATGTATEIIGGRQVTAIEAADWAAAFGALEQAGLPASLSGAVLRVPGCAAAEAEQALAGAGIGDYRVRELPATLEERFFELAGPGGAASLTVPGQRGQA